MSFLARSLKAILRQTTTINYLTNSLRTLSVTPCPLQQQKLEAVALPQFTKKHDKVIRDTKEDTEKCQEVFNKVNEQLAAGKEGRLFAVIHLCGKQFKITTGDIILVEGYWPPTIGDEISLDKVLLAGARDFTLIGTPILEPGLVQVKATIIEKTLTHTKTNFKKKRRKQFMRINFQRSPNTMIRINSIEIGRRVDDSATQSNEKRLF